jgi:hypothetical protein
MPEHVIKMLADIEAARIASATAAPAEATTIMSSL